MAKSIQIGKVAEQTGLSIDTIRFYQKIGLVKQPARTDGGFRLFSEAEIRDLVFIQKAHELGFSLTEIKQLSVLNQQHDHACSHVRDLLASKVRDVREKVDRKRLSNTPVPGRRFVLKFPDERRTEGFITQTTYTHGSSGVSGGIH